jgi:hypothetical protein
LSKKQGWKEALLRAAAMMILIGNYNDTPGAPDGIMFNIVRGFFSQISIRLEPIISFADSFFFFLW